MQPLWATLRLGDRARYMARAAQAVIDEFDELTDLIVAEQGRPRAEVEVMELLAGGRDAAVAGRARARASWPARRSPSRAPSTRSSAGAGATSRSGSSASSVRRPSRSPRRWATSRWRSWRATASSSSPRPTRRCAASGSRASSPAPACPRACSPSSTATPMPAPRSSPPRWPRSASPAGARGARGRRGVRARASSARCSRSAARTRCSCSPTPTVPRAVRGAAWAGFANAGQCGGSVERVLCVPRGP